MAFAKTIDGPVFLPGTRQYASAKLLFDTLHDAASPAAVVQPARVDDVQKAMLFAAHHNLLVSVRSGGHSYVGASAHNGAMVIDLRHLGDIAYAAGLAVVPPGAGLYDVHSALAQHGRTIPTGTCPTVGAGGLTLGGGLGVESRQWGLTCDRLAEADVVLPSGEALTASPKRHADLFWALQGGGGGNFGLVTSFRFRTHAASDKDIFTLTFPGSAAVALIRGWVGWLRAADGTRWANVTVAAEGDGTVLPRMVGVCPAGSGRATAADIIAAVGAQPTRSSYQSLSYLEAVRYLGGGTTSARQAFAAGSDVLPRVSKATATAIVGTIAARSRAGGYGAAILDPLDGAISARKASASAFPWRRATADVQWYVSVAGSGSYASAARWIGRAHRALASASAGGYVNYIETGMLASRYYAGNLEQLSAVRRAYDPHRRMYSGLVL